MPRFTYYLPQRLVMKYKNPFIHGTLMIKKKVLLKVGGYDERFYYSQDYKLYSDLLEAKIQLSFYKRTAVCFKFTKQYILKQTKRKKYYFDCVKKDKIPKFVI